MSAVILNQYGLRQKDMDYLLRLFADFPAIEKVILYGSRAAGNFRQASDIDFAVFGPLLTHADITRLMGILESDCPLLLSFDVLHYDTLKSESLKKEIDLSGKLIYSGGQRSTQGVQ